jgi:MoxR-like ATPase
MLRARLGRVQDEVRLEAAMDRNALLACQAAVETVTVADEMVSYITALVRATRENPKVQVGSSPRGSLSLLKLARARAALSGRDFVVPEDVQELAVASLAHRLTLRPELWAQRIRTADVIAERVQAVPVPPTVPAAMMSGTVDQH